MADSDSIMQLGVAAARDGNRDEARNLFRLLTRQQPDNAQGWLWLAGVANSRDEKQEALERVMKIDPDNEMAAKGLAALGVDVEAKRAEALQYAAAVPVPPMEPAPEPSLRDRYDFDDDDPYSSLDTLSDAMNDAPDAVRRAAPSPDDDDPYSSLDDMSDAMAGSSAVRRDPDDPRRTSSTTQRSSYSPSSSASTSNRTSGRYRTEGDEGMPKRRNPLLTGVLILLVLIAAIWALNRFGLFGGLFGGGSNVAEQPTSGAVETVPAGTAAAGGAATDAIPAATSDPNAPQATAPAAAGQATAPAAGEATAPAAGGQATAAQPAAQAGAALPSLETLAGAAPAPVAPGTALESNGWTYNFANSAYANNIFGPVGGVAPAQGRFIVVLLNLANTSGAEQTLAGEQFVLKDAQGRVYAASPDASSAYVNTFGRGVAADLSMQDSIPADGVSRSVALLFDVAPDASGLTLFASTNPGQGYQVLQ